MFGMTENPLIVGDKIFMTPGGEEHNMVALNKNTGELIWTSQGRGTRSSYCSPIFIGDQQVPMVVTWVGAAVSAGRGSPNDNELVAFNAETGEVIWAIVLPSGNTINPNTPIYRDNHIFVSTGYGGGSWLLRLSDGGRAIEQVWHHSDADNNHHGFVRVGNYIYTTSQNGRAFFCINWYTGETMWRVDHPQSSIIYADGMLYMYNDNGDMNLVRPTPERYELVSTFRITQGTNQHWAHPVIHAGVLYIRHGNALMAYRIK